MTEELIDWAADRVLTQLAEGLRAGFSGLDLRRRVDAPCVLLADNDMEAMAERYNQWHARAFALPLAADGHAYRRRQLARKRRR
jgi:uncharacterized protein (DUF934 family)